MYYQNLLVLKLEWPQILLQPKFIEFYETVQSKAVSLGCEHGVKESLMHTKLIQVFKYLRTKFNDKYADIGGLSLRSKFTFFTFFY